MRLKPNQRLVCNNILIQEFSGLKKKEWPLYVSGSVPGQKCYKGKFYRDRFLFNEDAYNKMIKRFKIVAEKYKLFYQAEKKITPGAILHHTLRVNKQGQTPNKKLKDTTAIATQTFLQIYGDFWKEMVVIEERPFGNRCRYWPVFNLNKLSEITDQKKFGNFIRLVKMLYDIDSFPGSRQRTREEIKKKAKELRKQGYSLNKIRSQLCILFPGHIFSPSTIDRWCKE